MQFVYRIVHFQELKGYTLIPQGTSCSGKEGLIIYLYDKFDYDYKLKLNKYKSFIIYADDTTLSTTLENVTKDTTNDNIEAKINMELASINDWLNSNKLSAKVNI